MVRVTFAAITRTVLPHVHTCMHLYTSIHGCTHTCPHTLTHTLPPARACARAPTHPRHPPPTHTHRCVCDRWDLFRDGRIPTSSNAFEGVCFSSLVGWLVGWLVGPNSDFIQRFRRCVCVCVCVCSQNSDFIQRFRRCVCMCVRACVCPCANKGASA